MVAPNKKSTSLDGLSQNFVCLYLGSSGFNWRFSFALVFQRCCLTAQVPYPKCLNTLFLLSLRLCFIIGFTYELSVVRDDSWMS